MLKQSESQNRVLSRLSPDDFALVVDQLELFRLSRGVTFIDADQPIEYAHFLERGVASVVASSPEGQLVEAGIIGREGFVHPMLAPGTDRIPYQVQIQLPAEGYRIRRADLLNALERSATLREVLLKFAGIFSTQVSYTVLSNSIHQIDERLARWLLMCHDRSESDELPLTHEFMSLMLAVRRPSVTNALHVLEGNRFIESNRGYVTIRNRAALEEFAADAYGKPESEYRRLLGPL